MRGSGIARVELRDDVHAPFATGGAEREVDAGEAEHLLACRLVSRRSGRGFGSQELPTARDARSAGAVGEQPVVADADEAFGKDVEEEATEELVDGDVEDLDSMTVGVVPVAECDAVILHPQDPAVRERNAMRVAAEVAEHALGSREGGLGVDDPVVLAKRVKENGQPVVGPELAPMTLTMVASPSFTGN